MIAVERFMGRTMAAGRSFIYTGNTGIHWTDARTSSPAGSRIGRAPVSAGATSRAPTGYWRSTAWPHEHSGEHSGAPGVVNHIGGMLLSFQRLLTTLGVGTPRTVTPGRPLFLMRNAVPCARRGRLCRPPWPRNRRRTPRSAVWSCRSHRVPDDGDQNQDQHECRDLQQDPHAGPPLVGEGTQARDAQREDRAHHPGGQFRECPWPDSDRRRRQQEQKQTGRYCRDAEYADEQGRAPREQEIVGGGRRLLPPIKEPHRENEEGGREIQGGPQPERDIGVNELVPVRDRRDTHQRGKEPHWNEAAPNRVPFGGPRRPEKEVRPAEVHRPEHHPGEPGNDPP